MATKSVKLDDDSKPAMTAWLESLGERDRIAILKDGEVVAGLVSPHELKRLEEIERDILERIRLAECIRQQFDGIPEEELIREAENAVREAREDMDRERRAKNRMSHSAAAM